MLEIFDSYVDEAFEKAVKALLPEVKATPIRRNQVIRFGAKPPYFPFAVHSEMIPQVFKNLKDIPFNSVGINEYLKNQEIPWHIDDPKAGPKIYIISLMSDATLKFRKDNQALEYYLPRFSLATISDDLRYNWQHYLKADDYRISVVFRNF